MLWGGQENRKERYLKHQNLGVEKERKERFSAILQAGIMGKNHKGISRIVFMLMASTSSSAEEVPILPSKCLTKTQMWWAGGSGKKMKSLLAFLFGLYEDPDAS